MERWSPFAKALQKSLGRRIVLRIAPDIETFEACLAAGAFHLAFINPYHFITFEDANGGAPGYTALVHRAGQGMRGIVVARTSQQITGLEDLAGMRLAFPSQGAFGASLLVRGELKARGIPFHPVYVKSHESVYLSVAAEAIDAGGGVVGTWRTAPSLARATLEVVHKTDAYTPHAFAARSDLPEADQRAITAALVAIGETHGQSLEPLGITGWVEPGADAYDDVRNLSITPQDAGMDDLDSRECPFASG